jgi:hypothetical protein
MIKLKSIAITIEMMWSQGNTFVYWVKRNPLMKSTCKAWKHNNVFRWRCMSTDVTYVSRHDNNQTHIKSRHHILSIVKYMYNFVLAVHLPAGIYTAYCDELWVLCIFIDERVIITNWAWPTSLTLINTDEKIWTRKHGYSAIKWRKKYHSVETILKYHSVETVLKYNRKW